MEGEIDWRVKKITLGKNKKIIDVELWGISEPLAIALREPVSQSRIMHVTMFSDSRMSLNKLREERISEGQALKSQIYRRATKLRYKGYNVTLILVHSHKRIEGNEEADRAARQAAIT